MEKDMLETGSLIKRVSLLIPVIMFGLLSLTHVSTAGQVEFAQEVKGHMEQPVDEVVGAHGEIYVLDKKLARIFIYDQNGHLIGGFGEKGLLPGQLAKPESIALSKYGEVIVADPGNSKVYVFANKGTLFYELGGKDARVQFSQPTSIAVSPLGKIFVADKENKIISAFNTKGNLLKQWLLNETPYDITFDQWGRFYCLFSEQHKIGQYNANMKKIKDFTTTTSIFHRKIDIQNLAVDRWGDIYLVERASHKIVKIDQNKKILVTFGSKGKEKGQFNGPEGITTDQEGYIYVADSRNKRVQKIFVEAKDQKARLASLKNVHQYNSDKMVDNLKNIGYKEGTIKEEEYVRLSKRSRPLKMNNSTDLIRFELSRKLLIKELKDELVAKTGVFKKDLDEHFKIEKETALQNGRVAMTASIPERIIPEKYTVLTKK